MKFTKKETLEKQEKKYIGSAPLMEKRKVKNISVILNAAENDTLDEHLEKLKDENGRKISRSNFVRSAIFEKIANAENKELPDEWLEEPLTVKEASERFSVPESTIRSALTSNRFTGRETKKIDDKITIVTVSGMKRLFKNRVV